jgi:hypothetical protein
MEAYNFAELEYLLMAGRLPIIIHEQRMIGHLIEMACICRLPIKDGQGYVSKQHNIKGHKIRIAYRLLPGFSFIMVTFFLSRGFRYATCCKYLKLNAVEIVFSTDARGRLELRLEKTRIHR